MVLIMEALAELTFAGSVTRSKGASASFVRELVPADMALLLTERGVKAPMLKRINDRHHALARYLALGYSKTECSALTGYDPSRISILLADDSFKMLVSDYRGIADAQVDGFQDRALTLADSVLAELQERIENDPEEIAVGTLLEVGKFARDSAGKMPVAKSVQTNVNLNVGDRLREARQRVSASAAGAAQDEPVLQGQPLEARALSLKGVEDEIAEDTS
jgi:hypothetical protein